MEFRLMFIFLSHPNFFSMTVIITWSCSVKGDILHFASSNRSVLERRLQRITVMTIVRSRYLFSSYFLTRHM
jgi:hypothetical protein